MRLRSVINPLPVGYHLARIRQRDRWPQQRQQRYQQQLLTQVVEHAVRTVPYYRDLFAGATPPVVRSPADLVRLPVLDRETVRANRTDAALFADGFGPANTRQHATSGSSGIPIVMHNSERDLGYLRASYLNDMIATGLRPLDRVAYFRPGTFLNHPLERFGILPTAQIDTRAVIDDQVAAFLRFRPTFLTGFPATIASVVDELRRRGVRYDGVRRVVFGGERLTPGLRSGVLDYLGADGLEVYASVEVFTIARACPLGRLHLRTLDVVVEVEQDDGTVAVADGNHAAEGEILVTRLHSEAMPILRYRLGDRVRVEPSRCPCRSSDAPVVAAVLGRSQDLLYGADGRGASVDVINKPLLEFTELSRVQVVQEGPGVVEVRVVLVPGSGDDVPAAMRDVVARQLPGWTVSVRVVDEIEPGPNGKIQVVRSVSGWNI